MTDRAAKKASYIDLFDRIQEPLLIIDPNFKVIDANPGAESFFGLSLDQLKDFQISNLFESSEQMHKEIRVVFRRYHPRVSEKSVVINGQLKHLKIETCCLELSDFNAEPSKVVQILIKDQTELVEAKKSLELEKQKLEEANKLLAEISITDKLTGLFNRRHFDDTLSKEFERAERTKNNLSLILFDVDNFKHYNDVNGHIPGDKLLEELAKVVTENIRQIDIACRYGGEEFVVICPHTNSQEALIVAERIRLAVASFAFDGRTTQPLGCVSVSVGISSFPEHTTSAAELKKLADKALYSSKHSGRNRTSIISNK